MDTNELELLKKVLPPYLSVAVDTEENRQGKHEQGIFDEEGDLVVQLHERDTACTVTCRLLDRARVNGKAEGRQEFQRELLTLLGVHGTLHGLMVNANEMETDLRQLTRTVEGLVKNR
jgi:hypothetical protein